MSGVAAPGRRVPRKFTVLDPALESNGHASDHPLRGSHHEKFVVDGGVQQIVAEETP
jgi:hypothetical protein